MILSVNHPLWKEIYQNLLKNTENQTLNLTIYSWESWLLQYNIRVVRVGGRVEEIILPTDNQELTLFLIKWTGDGVRNLQ